MTVTFKHVYKSSVPGVTPPPYKPIYTLYFKHNKEWIRLDVSSFDKLRDIAVKQARKKPVGKFLIVRGNCPFSVLGSLDLRPGTTLDVVWAGRAKALVPERFQRILKGNRTVWKEVNEKQLSIFDIRK